jgi:hypothetical protein
MPYYIIPELPESIVELLESVTAQASAQYQGTDIKKIFWHEILYKLFYFNPRGYNETPNWAFYEFNLNKPWKGNTHIRLFAHTFTTKNLGFTYKSSSSVLLFKKSDGAWEHFFLDDNHSKTLENEFSKFASSRALGALDSRQLAENDFWTNLRGYNAQVLNFYQKQNSATALTLANLIDKNMTEKPVMVIDLGCGTGSTERHFTEQLLKEEHLNKVIWLGIDRNESNPKTAQSLTKNKNAYFIEADAQTFCEQPLQTLKIDQLQNAWNESNVLVIASGLLTEQVLSFPQAIQIMRALSQHSQIKKILLTGLESSHITPYIAKQMGYQRSNVEINGNSIEIYEPMQTTEHFIRIKNKMRKNRVLDLSYMQNYAELLDQITEEEIKEVDFIFFAGVMPKENAMEEFCRLMQINPRLLCWCASLNQNEKDLLENQISRAKYPIKFISLGYLHDAPLFSPTFFSNTFMSQVKIKDLKQLESLPIQFMRGVTSDSRGSYPHALYQRIMLTRLFIALNEDTSEDTEIKQMIADMLNQKPIRIEIGNSSEILIEKIKKSNVSAPLKAMACDFIHIMSIEVYAQVNNQIHSCSLIDSSTASSLRARELYNCNQGIFTDEEWYEFSKRFITQVNSTLTLDDMQDDISDMMDRSLGFY